MSHCHRIVSSFFQYFCYTMARERKGGYPHGRTRNAIHCPGGRIPVPRPLQQIGLVRPNPSDQERPDIRSWAVQEAFAIAWSKWEDLFASPNPAGWLYNTVNNVVRNMIRADQQWASRLLQAQAALSHQPFQPPPGADLELEGLVSQEDLDLLKRLYLEGMTYEELAAEENLNQNTLAARVRRIKLRFQKIYREIEHFSDPPCKKSDTARHKEKRGGSKL